MQILKTVGMVFCLLVFCSCIHQETSNKSPHLSLYPKEAPLAFLQYLEKSLESRRFQVADPEHYREFFGADSHWSRKGNVLPVRLSFLPSQTQRHMYLFEAYVADTRQDNGDYVFVTLKGGIPQGDTIPTLEISTAKLSNTKTPPFLPDSSILERLQKVLFARIDKGTMTWETVTSPPLQTSVKNPYSEWRKERFQSSKGELTLSRSDLTLTEIAARPNARVRFSFSVAPLMTNIGGNRLMLTILSFDMDRFGRILSTEIHSETILLPYMTIRQLSPEDRNEISELVLRNLFEFPLPSDVRTQERVRFCYPVAGANGKFYKLLHKDAAIPECNPFKEDPQLPVQFDRDKKAYTTLKDGAFHYYAGYVLPVNENTAYVFGATFACAGTTSRPEVAMRFSKGFFGSWKPTHLWIHHSGSSEKK